MIQICFEGPDGVGKMAVHDRIRHGAFTLGRRYDAPCDPTARASAIVDGQKYVYDIYVLYEDRGLRELAERNSHGFVLIYSVDSPESLEKHVNRIEHLSQNNIPFIIVANKMDLDNKIAHQTGLELAKRVNVPFIEVSCLNNTGVYDVVPAIIREVSKKRPALTQQQEEKQKEKCIIS